MMTLIAAAAVAAAQPAPAQAAPMQQHHEHMQMGQRHEQMQMGHDADHKGMDCCKECCEHMTGKHDGHQADHAAHSGR